MVRAHGHRLRLWSRVGAGNVRPHYQELCCRHIVCFKLFFSARQREALDVWVWFPAPALCSCLRTFTFPRGEPARALIHLARARAQCLLRSPHLMCPKTLGWLTAHTTAMKTGFQHGVPVELNSPVCLKLVCEDGVLERQNCFGFCVVFDTLNQNQNVFVLPFLQAMSQRASHTLIELPLNQPKPSRKTGEKSQKNSLEEKRCKKPWQELFSERSPPP